MHQPFPFLLTPPTHFDGKVIPKLEYFPFFFNFFFFPEMPHKKALSLARGLLAVCLPGQNAAAIKGFSWEIYLQQNLISNRKSFHWRLLNTFPSADPRGVWL